VLAAGGAKRTFAIFSTWAFIAVCVPEAVVPLGIHVNRQHGDVNRASEVHSLFRIEEH
jgi:hypothetical protein